MPVAVAARSKAMACGRSNSEIVGLNPTGDMRCCEFCAVSSRSLCKEVITRLEESYRLCCVVVCDLETSWMRRPWPTRDCRAKNKQTNCWLYINIQISYAILIQFLLFHISLTCSVLMLLRLRVKSCMLSCNLVLIKLCFMYLLCMYISVSLRNTSS
jgi:hypothetical protein